MSAALPNKPLLEAIFELRWQLNETQPGFAKDPGFSILNGRYYEFARKAGYPVLVELSTAQLPDEMAPFIPRYQFWKDKNEWPVTQIGPGVLTVNSTKEYKWETFLVRIKEALKAVKENYPNDIHKFVPISISLKYIDIVPFIGEQTGENIRKFLKENFHTDIKIDDDIFNNDDKEKMEGLKLNLSYKLSEPMGVGKITIGNGMHNGKPIIGWDTEIKSVGSLVPVDDRGFDDWLLQSHILLKKWFIALTNGPLLKSFQEEKNAK